MFFSLLHSTMNCGRSFCIIHHLTSNLLPYYLAKFECSTVQLYAIVIQFKSVTDRLFAVNIYRNVLLWIMCLSVPINLQYYSICSNYLPSARMHSFCAKRVAGAIAIYCAGMMSDDVIGTRERQLSSNKSI